MDWIIAGLMAVSLVLLLITLLLDGRLRKLEKEVKDGMKATGPVDFQKMLEDEIVTLTELQKENEEKMYNQSYGDPTYTEWIDRDYDSKGVK